MQANIRPDGTITFIWNDALADLMSLGKGLIKRASHVEPTADGQWTADMSPVCGGGGPVLGPFPLRGEALQAEVVFLQNLI